MNWRANLLAAGLIIAALSASHGAAYLRGRGDAEREQALVAAGDNQAAAGANAAVGAEVIEASGRLGEVGVRTTQEAADARRGIERNASPPPAGKVGARALVDPAVSRPLLCRIERLRGIATGPACADAAAHRAEPSAADGGGLS